MQDLAEISVLPSGRRTILSKRNVNRSPRAGSAMLPPAGILASRYQCPAGRLDIHSENNPPLLCVQLLLLSNIRYPLLDNQSHLAILQNALQTDDAVPARSTRCPPADGRDSVSQMSADLASWYCHHLIQPFWWWACVSVCPAPFHISGPCYPALFILRFR